MPFNNHFGPPENSTFENQDNDRDIIKTPNDDLVELKRDFLARVFANDIYHVQQMSTEDMLKVVEARDINGRTPLMIAAYRGFNEMLELLIFAGAQQSAEDNDGRSAYNFMENFGEEKKETEVRMSVRDAILHSTINAARNKKF